MKHTRKELLQAINSLESSIKFMINEKAEKLVQSPEVLESLRFQLNDWKELVNPITRGTKLDALSDIEKAYTIAGNIFEQVEWHLNDLLER